MSIDIPTPAGPEHATDRQIEEIAQDVWAAFTGIDIEPAEAGPYSQHVVTAATGTVHVDGQWHGRIHVTCTLSLAKAAASAMFAKPAERLSAADIADALGELTNVIGGNIKSVLPGPSRLSLPDVTIGVDTIGAYTTDASPDDHRSNSVTLSCPDGRLTITVWRHD
jgi:chemotaxis protein CheX